MRFKDEKIMWYAEVETLARELANKTEREVWGVLDGRDIVYLRSEERPEVTVFGRVLFPFVFIIAAMFSVIKWIITGDRYLDSVAKKYKIFDKILKYVGIE